MLVSDLIEAYADYDSFARRWHAATLEAHELTLDAARERDVINERDTRRVWRLLGLIGENSVFVQLPEWLVEAKSPEGHRSVPTTFVGRIAHETQAAVLFKESVPVRRLMPAARKIHSIERGIENTPPDSDRRKRLRDTLEAAYRKFDAKEAVGYLSDEWLPKSQLVLAVRRTDAAT